MELAELIKVWREHRGAITHEEMIAAKREVFDFLDRVRAE